MKVSTRGRYGLRAMVDLGLNQGSGPIPLREISSRQGISDQYLEQLFAKLRKAGLVKSVRGAHGGYLLSQLPEEITVKEILLALEGSLAPVDCVLDAKACGLVQECVTHHLWFEITEQVDKVLSRTTLHDLLLIARNKGVTYYEQNLS